MGFHKRYINDDQVIGLYHDGGVDAVIDWYTSKVDALILSGKLSEEVGLLMNVLPFDQQGAKDKISAKIQNASVKKGS